MEASKHMSDTPELPFVRPTDPATSVLAAGKAARASSRAVAAVRAVMSDGRARIDEEIWRECRAAGYVSSFDTIRHGRVALSRSGILVETGETRETGTGSPSREWRATEGRTP